MCFRFRYVEAALFAIHLVGSETCRNLNDKSYVQQKPAVADKIATYLKQLFHELTNNKLYSSNPFLAQTGCKIFASHIKFIKAGYHQRLPQLIVPDVMMQNALSYLCNGLMLQGVRITASQAMRVVSVDYICCTQHAFLEALLTQYYDTRRFAVHLKTNSVIAPQWVILLVC